MRELKTREWNKIMRRLREEMRMVYSSTGQELPDVQCDLDLRLIVDELFPRYAKLVLMEAMGLAKVVVQDDDEEEGEDDAT